MRRTMLGIGLVLLSVSAALAHHSFAAEYDASKRVTKQGFVTKVDWQNPHVLVYFDVKDASTGKIENWSVELGPPQLIQRSGWTPDTLRPDDEIIVTGSPAKNGSLKINAGQNGITRAGRGLLARQGSRAIGL
jgi:hypothetical protein